MTATLQRSSTEFAMWTIDTLAKLQDAEEIFLDLGFQSPERWSKGAANSYLSSVFRKFTPAPIILARVESCMNHCEDRLGKDSPDYTYFAGLHTQNIKYISVDGNNRTRTIMKFFNNKLPLKQGYTYRMDGMTIPEFMNYTPTSPTTFRGMPEKLKQHIRNIEIPVFVAHEATRQELHDMFIAVNNGVALNPQEKRNAIVCTVADSIRQLGVKYKDLFRLYFSEANFQRRIHEEFLVSNLVHLAHGFGSNITKDDRDKAYNNLSLETKKLGELKEVLKDVDSLCQYETKTGSSRGIPSKASLFDLMMLIDWLRKENISILNDSDFFEWFVVTMEALRRDKTFVAISETDPRTYYGAQRATDGWLREARLAQLIARLENLPDGTLSVAKDTKRFGDSADRIYCWTRQNKKCELTNKTIPWADVLDGNKTHLDHIVPHSKGGKTDRSNLQLVYKAANLLKSNH